MKKLFVLALLAFVTQLGATETTNNKKLTAQELTTVNMMPVCVGDEATCRKYMGGGLNIGN